MKTLTKIIFALSILSFLIMNSVAAESERLLTLTLAGYFQDRDSSGNDIAVPFRASTRDLLEEISLTTGTNVTGGILLVVDSIGETNGVSRIIARTVGTQVDVTDFFEISQGESVETVKFSRGSFKSATFYAIDQFRFSTLSGTNGLELTLQTFTQETQAAKTFGTNAVAAASSKADGNGELRSGEGFIGPVRGSLKIGTPRFFP